MLWCISVCPPMAELRPWVRDLRTSEWRPQNARLLAVSLNGARALTPAGSTFEYGYGRGRHRTEWWRAPEQGASL